MKVPVSTQQSTLQPPAQQGEISNVAAVSMPDEHSESTAPLQLSTFEKYLILYVGHALNSVNYLPAVLAGLPSSVGKSVFDFFKPLLGNDTGEALAALNLIVPLLVVAPIHLAGKTYSGSEFQSKDIALALPKLVFDKKVAAYLTALMLAGLQSLNAYLARHKPGNALQVINENAFLLLPFQIALIAMTCYASNPEFRASVNASVGGAVGAAATKVSGMWNAAKDRCARVEGSVKERDGLLPGAAAAVQA